jgi:hypothetical protein
MEAVNNIKQITIDNYLLNGKVNRVFIASLENNILVDLKIQSYPERMLITTFIRMLRMVSFLFPSFSINIHKKSLERA